MTVPGDEHERTRLALQVAEVAHEDEEATLGAAVRATAPRGVRVAHEGHLAAMQVDRERQALRALRQLQELVGLAEVGDESAADPTQEDGELSLQPRS
eukprot:9010497-Alexandrium_andersonii.AAC.1